MSRGGVNKVILIGNLGGDPEVRHTPSGTAVARVNLATNESWTDRASGERQEKTEWHRLVFWGRQAEIASQYLRKGSKIYVEGRLQTDSWDDKQSGQKRYMTEVVVRDLQMLDSRGDGRGDGGDGGGRTPQEPGGPGGEADGGHAPPPGSGPEDDDLPF